MKSPDLIIGLQDTELNAALSQIYSKPEIRDRLFSGSEKSEFDGVSFRGDWRIQSSPELEFRQPSKEELNVSTGNEKGEQPLPANTFIINLHQLDLAMTTSGGTKKTSSEVKAIGKVESKGNNVLLQINSVIVDLSKASPLDQFIFKAIIIPKIVASINKTLKGINIPIPSFPGIEFSPPKVGIESGQLVSALNMKGKRKPAISTNLPKSPFFMLMSQHLEEKVVDHIINSEIRKKNLKDSGSKEAAGFSGYYSVSGKVNHVTAKITSNLMTLKTSIGLDVYAKGGIGLPTGYIIDGANIVAKGAKDAANKVADGAKKAWKETKKVANKINPSKW